jgi:hypothetical protein
MIVLPDVRRFTAASGNKANPARPWTVVCAARLSSWVLSSPSCANGAAITNQNTVIYVLINPRALQRLRQRKAN